MRKSKNKNGAVYEQHVANKMRLHGFLFVQQCGKSGDYGADIIARTFFMSKIVVQCKKYSGKVGVKAVQEIFAAKQYYGASIAIVATNSTFTASAKKLAKACNVCLWERY